MDNSEWIRGNVVAPMLGVEVRHVAKIAEAEGIRTRRLPGTYPHYFKPDVLELARRCVVGKGVAVEQMSGAGV